MSRLTDQLLRPIDNAPLIIFRIFLGFLLAAETFGAIMTGWVRRILIEPQFTFSHIGLDWLQPLPGNGMYYYFATMGVLGICVMLGYKYRLTLGLYTILWAGVYFMQKSAYNNHYYLLLLVCLIMLVQPANRYASIDAKINPEIKSYQMPFWCSAIMILQIFIVYFYATVAKLYPDWLDGTFTKNLFSYNQFAETLTFFKSRWFHLFLAYSGILFDLLIIPFLLWKRTRTLAFIAAIFFHLFNAIVLQIGIFPFFALSFVVFFYPPEKIGKLFFRKRIIEEPQETTFRFNKKILGILIIYFIIQILLPLRHWTIKGDVLWTEEGHRLSWRMMLRHRYGTLNYKVVDKSNNQEIYYNFRDKLTPKQKVFVSSNPDGIWQMAQYIKKDMARQGIDVAVYAKSYMTVNYNIQRVYIDENVDLASVPWNYFFHNDWILLYDKEGNLIK